MIPAAKGVVDFIEMPYCGKQISPTLVLAEGMQLMRKIALGTLVGVSVGCLATGAFAQDKETADMIEALTKSGDRMLPITLPDNPAGRSGAVSLGAAGAAGVNFRSAEVSNPNGFATLKKAPKPRSIGALGRALNESAEGKATAIAALTGKSVGTTRSAGVGVRVPSDARDSLGPRGLSDVSLGKFTPLTPENK